MRNFYLLGVAVCLMVPALNGAAALLLGIIMAVCLGNPMTNEFRRWAPQALAFAVAGMGGGVFLPRVLAAGQEGLVLTLVSIVIILASGHVLSRALRCSADLGLLISGGTAICGGSAIAALSKTIHAKPRDISVALACVFLLNALALLIFPSIGKFFALSQHQFGMWAALAIHDTSSVVGAAMIYGSEALEIATVTKLARALWIIPMCLAIGWIRRDAQQSFRGILKKQWFILAFLLMATVVSLFPILQPAGAWMAIIAKRLFVVSLFMIGSCVAVADIRTAGWQPLLLAILLWLITSIGSLVLVLSY